MIPFQSILTPLFLVLHYIHLQNTLLGLALVYITFQLPFAIFMMRNSFDTVPRELEEAALLDGCSSSMIRMFVSDKPATCQSCTRTDTPEPTHYGYDAATQRQALRLYSDGMNLRRDRPAPGRGPSDGGHLGRRARRGPARPAAAAG